MHVNGPGLGPVRTTIWSSGSHRGSGKGCAVVMLVLFVPVLLWDAVHTVLGAVLIGLFTIAAIDGFMQQHQRNTATPVRAHAPGKPHYGAAGPDDAAAVADLNARPANVRAALRAQCQAGELAMIPGYHWTDGDVQVRDEAAQPESPAKYSDRR